MNQLSKHKEHDVGPPRLGLLASAHYTTAKLPLLYALGFCNHIVRDGGRKDDDEQRDTSHSQCDKVGDMWADLPHFSEPVHHVHPSMTTTTTTTTNNINSLIKHSFITC